MTTAIRRRAAAVPFQMWWLALAYLLFVVYGSLVPLQLRVMEFAEAWGRFWSLAEQHSLRTSSVDWAVNIVLYVPLSFCWLGALWHRWQLGARLAASILVLLFGMLVSGGIEFAQLYVPSRTSSFNDIVANSLGSALGVLAWWLFGRRVHDWFASLQGGIARAELQQKFLLAYLLLLGFYNLMPLDLSISPVEIYHKWKGGMVRLLPFAALPTDPGQAAYGMLSDIGLWAIPAWLMQRSGSYRSPQIVARLVAAATAIEFLQLFVMSRVSDSTSILLATVGACIGLTLARLDTDWLDGHRSLLLSVWSVVVLAVQWYPYQFHADWHAALLEIDQTLAGVPLAAYYQNSELGALTSMLRKMALFLPLGILLRLRGSSALNKRMLLPTVLPVLGLALLVEWGQALQPGRAGDIADLLLQCVGAAVGWCLCNVLLVAAPGPAIAGPVVVRPVAVPRARQRNTWPWLLLGGGAAALLGAGLLLPRLTSVPYNLRELIAADAPLRSALLLCVSAYWIGAAPLLATPMLARGSRWLGSIVLWPLLHGLGAFLLLWLAVPQEAIDDVIGSPVLGWPLQWEQMLRFVGLFSVWSVWLCGAVLMAGRRRLTLDQRVIPIWYIAALLWLPLAYWVVVIEAGTDNLIELIAGGAAWWAAAALGLALALFLLAVTLAGRWLVGRPSRRWWGGAMLLLALPLVYGLVWLGSETRLFKYQQVFSALQFLLSSDRRHYVDPTELWARFALIYGVAALGLLLVQLPFWQLLCGRADRLDAASRERRRAASGAH